MPIKLSAVAAGNATLSATAFDRGNVNAIFDGSIGRNVRFPLAQPMPFNLTSGDTNADNRVDDNDLAIAVFNFDGMGD